MTTRCPHTNWPSHVCECSECRAKRSTAAQAKPIECEAEPVATVDPIDQLGFAAIVLAESIKLLATAINLDVVQRKEAADKYQAMFQADDPVDNQPSMEAMTASEIEGRKITDESLQQRIIELSNGVGLTPRQKEHIAFEIAGIARRETAGLLVTDVSDEEWYSIVLPGFGVPMRHAINAMLRKRAGA